MKPPTGWRESKTDPKIWYPTKATLRKGEKLLKDLGIAEGIKVPLWAKWQNKPKKKWYDNWHTTTTYHDRGRISLDVNLPHSYGMKKVHFRSVPDKRVRWLAELVECALYELSRRDKS